MVSLVSAVGISKDYHEGNPVLVGPGETKEVVFGRLMATQETEDRTIEIGLIEGSEIASVLNDESFVVAAGSRDTELKVRISIPSDVPEGTEYTVTLSIKDATLSQGSGMVMFTETKTSSIPVLVQKTEEPEEDAGLGVWTWVLIIAVVVVILLILAKVLNKPSKPVRPVRKR